MTSIDSADLRPILEAEKFNARSIRRLIARRIDRNSLCDSQDPELKLNLIPMPNEPAFKSASPYQNDILALPVTDLDTASSWYCRHFGMTEIERRERPVPTVILERDGMRLGFAINGGDASQDGAAILVTNIRKIKDNLELHGTTIANWRVDERDGKKLQVFFVVAPDGLCYYFHEPIDAA